MPPHILELKINSIVMLIRNVDKTQGLCNGTRLIITHLGIIKQINYLQTNNIIN